MKQSSMFSHEDTPLFSGTPQTGHLSEFRPTEQPRETQLSMLRCPRCGSDQIRGTIQAGSCPDCKSAWTNPFEFDALYDEEVS